MLLHSSTNIVSEQHVLTVRSEMESVQWAALLSEMESVQWAAHWLHLSTEEIEQAIIHEWNSLQQVPSYVERLRPNNGDQEEQQRR